jgi:Tfp pilus assembly protein PilO
MNRMRTWSLGAAGLAFLILVAGWFLLISPTKSKVSDLQAQTAAQNATNAGLQTQIAQLKLQNKNLPKQEAKLAKIRQHLPATPALPTFVRTLTTIAHESDVKLVVVTPTPPVVVTTQAPAPVATPSASASDGAAATDVAPAAPVAVPTGLKQIPVSITVSGGYYNIVQFLTKVEGLQRSMLVYGISIQPDDAAASAGTSSSTSSATHLKVAFQTRIFYSPPVVAPPVTTPATGATPASSGAAAPATAS